MNNEEILPALRKLAVAKSLDAEERLLKKLAETEGSVERVIPYLDHDDPAIRRAAIEVLGCLGPEIGPGAAPAVPSLIRVLREAIEYRPDGHPANPIDPPIMFPDAQVACSTLAKIGEPANKALPELRRCAELQIDGCSTEFLSLEAAGAIWDIAGDAEPAVRIAHRFLEDPLWSPFDGVDGECELVIDLVGRIGPSAASALAVLERTMVSDDLPEAVKERLVEALARIKGEE